MRSVVKYYNRNAFQCFPMLSLPMHTSNCNKFYNAELHCKDFTEARPIALHCGADVISRLARLMAAAGDSSAQLINPNCVLQVL